MTTYTAIPNTDIDPDSPVTTGLMTLLRDNPLAIQEGDASAPKVANAALAGYPFAATSGVTGTWALIEAWTPTAVAAHDFTWDESVYGQVYLEIADVSPTSDGANIYMRMGYANGGTIITSANYAWARQSWSSGVYTAWASVTTTGDRLVMSITGSGIGSAAGEGVSGNVRLIGPESTLSYTGYVSEVSYITPAGVPELAESKGHYKAASAAANAIDTLQIGWLAGTFDAGIGAIRLYGLKRA